MTSLRRSPPTERVVSVLDYFAARPDARCGLSDVARALDLSKPTCLGILTTLADRSYLTCDPATKTYGLGPALVRVGQTARTRYLAADAARPVLAELSEQYRTNCTASAVIGNWIVILASTDVGDREPFVPVGQRYPFAPPMGLMHVAWRDDAALEHWLEMPSTIPGAVDSDQLRAIVADSRRRGFLVEALTPAGRQLHSLVAGVAAYDLPDELRELVGEMVADLGERVYVGSDVPPHTKHAVSVLAAPTFDETGEEDLVLSLYVGHSITGTEISRRGAALVQAADRVTRAVGGKPPRRRAQDEGET